MTAVTEDLASALKPAGQDAVDVAPSHSIGLTDTRKATWTPGSARRRHSHVHNPASQVLVLSL